MRAVISCGQEKLALITAVCFSASPRSGRISFVIKRNSVRNLAAAATGAAMIQSAVDWFAKSPDNNILYESRNDEENKDVYMVALRDDTGKLIGYYEKHCYRTNETGKLFDMK